MRKVVHFEIPADDLDRAKNFYGPGVRLGPADIAAPIPAGSTPPS